VTWCGRAVAPARRRGTPPAVALLSAAHAASRGGVQITRSVAPPFLGPPLAAASLSPPRQKCRSGDRSCGSCWLATHKPAPHHTFNAANQVRAACPLVKRPCPLSHPPIRVAHRRSIMHRARAITSAPKRRLPSSCVDPNNAKLLLGAYHVSCISVHDAMRGRRCPPPRPNTRCPPRR